VRCIPPYIRASQRHADAPRLTGLAKAALARVVEMADSKHHHLSMTLNAGDMQFINNHHVMHGRTEYEHGPNQGAVRHLKRLWLETRFLSTRPIHFRNTNPDWVKNRSISRVKAG